MAFGQPMGAPQMGIDLPTEPVHSPAHNAALTMVINPCPEGWSLTNIGGQWLCTPTGTDQFRPVDARMAMAATGTTGPPGGGLTPNPVLP